MSERRFVFMQKIKLSFNILNILLMSILAIACSVLIYSILELILQKLMLSPIMFTKNKIVCSILSILLGLAFCIITFLTTKAIRNAYNKIHSNDSKIINSKKKLIMNLIAMIIILYGGSLLIQFLLCNSNGTQTTYNQSTLNEIFSTGTLNKIYITFLSLMLAPIIEELIYRWGILTVIKNALLKEFGRANISIHHFRLLNCCLLIFSATAFSLLHMPHTFYEFLSYGWLGVCIGIFYLKYNNIYASMLFHILINAIALAAMFFY